MLRAFLPSLGLVFLLFVSTVVFSQGRFEAGQIFTVEEDTIAGYIKELTNEENCKFITFSVEEDGSNAQEYRAGDLVGYRLANGRVFHSKQVESFALPEKEITASTPPRVDRFVQLLGAGDVSLYRLYNIDRTVLLLNRESSPLADAIYQVLVFPDRDSKQSIDWPRDTIFEKSILTASNGQFFVDKAYIDLFKRYFVGCTDLKIEEDYPLNPTSVRNILNRYNLCVTGEKLQKPKQKNKFGITAFGGYNLNISTDIKGNATTLGLEFSNQAIFRTITFSVAYHGYNQIESEESRFVFNTPLEPEILDIYEVSPRLNAYFTLNKRINPYFFAGISFVNGTSIVNQILRDDDRNIIGVRRRKAPVEENVGFMGVGFSFNFNRHLLKTEFRKVFQSSNLSFSQDLQLGRVLTPYIRLVYGYQLFR